MPPQFTAESLIPVGCVDVVGDSDESHTVGREHPAEVSPGFDVLTAQPGEVFDNDAVDFPIGDILHHLLESGAVKDDTTVAIVNFVGYNFNIGVALNEVFNELALVGYAVALTGAIIGVRQADIGSCFVARFREGSLKCPFTYRRFCCVFAPCF